MAFPTAPSKADALASHAVAGIKNPANQQAMRDLYAKVTGAAPGTVIKDGPDQQRKALQSFYREVLGNAPERLQQLMSKDESKIPAEVKPEILAAKASLPAGFDKLSVDKQKEIIGRRLKDNNLGDMTRAAMAVAEKLGWQYGGDLTKTMVVGSKENGSELKFVNPSAVQRWANTASGGNPRSIEGFGTESFFKAAGDHAAQTAAKPVPQTAKASHRAKPV